MVSGVINIYKEAGFTSQDVVAAVKKIFGGVKAGHTGTLDPMARGALPVCLGKATKIADFLQAGDKAYEATMRLGMTTDTEDTTGKILKQNDVVCEIGEIADAANSFVGKYIQTPPMYSAVSVNGRRLYKLARMGVEVERPAREVAINEIKIVSYDPPDVILTVYCSKGTYIRTLIKDIGERLGCGACMASLVRTRTGTFSAGNAIKLRELRDSGDAAGYVIPVEDALPLRRFAAAPDADRRLLNGNSLPVEMIVDSTDLTACENFFIYDSGGTLRGIYGLREDGRAAPVAMLI